MVPGTSTSWAQHVHLTVPPNRYQTRYVPAALIYHCRIVCNDSAIDRTKPLGRSEREVL